MALSSINTAKLSPHTNRRTTDLLKLAYSCRSRPCLNPRRRNDGIRSRLDIALNLIAAPVDVLGHILGHIARRRALSRLYRLEFAPVTLCPLFLL